LWWHLRNVVVTDNVQYVVVANDLKHSGLLVAWHYREVPRERREALIDLASSIYKK